MRKKSTNRLWYFHGGVSDSLCVTRLCRLSKNVYLRTEQALAMSPFVSRHMQVLLVVKVFWVFLFFLIKFSRWLSKWKSHTWLCCLLDNQHIGHQQKAMSDKILLTQDMVASNDILNPFIHHLELTTTYDKIRVSLKN